ncbi:hypothetical protein [Clostridium sp.]|uniref:hypothetical protein n=1 Tax=Clostridium sp. TaxID=1506 RepID=UPI0029106249|nr:hypothetical protein [Clostridium sp.]MDU5106873.1 hypothetical protein [Clostridium sp.]
MNSKRKALTMVLCALLLVSATMFATIAYLTSKDEVNNTFKVGNVHITLDEAKVKPDGTPVPNADRVKENEYKLIPGHSYTKDPTVTVEANSEECYVRALVTINKREALYNLPSDINIEDCFDINENWIFKSETEDIGEDTYTYEFWYNTTVKTSSTDNPLPAVFTTITVPSSLTNEQLNTLKDLEINVVAHAIQADGFDTAEKAWEAFGK